MQGEKGDKGDMGLQGQKGERVRIKIKLTLNESTPSVFLKKMLWVLQAAGPKFGDVFRAVDNF